jgi:hypothetical protein
MVGGGAGGGGMCIGASKGDTVVFEVAGKSLAGERFEYEPRFVLSKLVAHGATPAIRPGARPGSPRVGSASWLRLLGLLVYPCNSDSQSRLLCAFVVSACACIFATDKWRVPCRPRAIKPSLYCPHSVVSHFVLLFYRLQYSVMNELGMWCGKVFALSTTLNRYPLTMLGRNDAIMPIAVSSDVNSRVWTLPSRVVSRTSKDLHVR